MAIPLGLAKVSGAVRCNRWSKKLDGVASVNNDDSYFPPVQNLFSHLETYVKKSQYRNKRKPIK